MKLNVNKWALPLANFLLAMVEMLNVAAAASFNQKKHFAHPDTEPLLASMKN